MRTKWRVKCLYILFKLRVGNKVMSRERVNRRQKDIARLLRGKKQFVKDKFRKERGKKSGS